MRMPKNPTPEQRERVRAYMRAYRDANRERRRAYVAANREKIAAHSRTYRQAHQDQLRERQRARRQEPEGKARHRAAAARYRQRHRDRLRAAAARRIAELCDGYIARDLLGARLGEVPPEVIAAKREILRVKRLLGVTRYQGG